SDAALLTDQYELTMAASYHKHGKRGRATFDLFVRELPPDRNFLVAAGIEDALDHLENLRFDADDIAYLRTLQLFEEDFLDLLGELRFSGDVWSLPEGEIFFAKEPLLSVTAPLIEAQLVETYLLNATTFPSSVATKAARIQIAAQGRSFVDFSLRRDHGPDAGLIAARASYIGGADATSNVLAGKVYGLPLSGTMAHSYVMTFDSEMEAFRTFARDFPTRAVLLIDTYDVEEGARRAAKVAQELQGDGVRLAGVRIDSGDLGTLTVLVRKILDEGGCQDVPIFLSGDLDEFRIARLIASGAPADAFGVGTQLGTSADAPALGGVYKLVADENGPKMKTSTGKASLPGRKQIFRCDDGGRYVEDILAVADEDPPHGRPLLQHVMDGGKRLREPETLAEIRRRCAEGLSRLPDHLRELKGSRTVYPVTVSEALGRLAQDAATRTHE
ncbi:MAG: nicotinate phosphoribosyltransferase, partial [Actinomycetota bacterium]